jgi:predicted transcriptional regulator
MLSELDKELFNFVLQLNEAEKKSLLQMLKTFLKSRNKKASHINIEQYNKEIEEAIARVEAGEFFTQDEVEKMSKAW